MSSPNELARYLHTIRNTVASNIRPDLQSDYAKDEATAVVTLLDRITTVLDAGESIASVRLETWQSIGKEFTCLDLGSSSSIATEPEGITGSGDALRGSMDDVQQALRSEAAMSELVGRLGSGEESARIWYERTVEALADLSEASEPVVAATATRGGDDSTGGEAQRLRVELAAYLHRRFPAIPENAITHLRIAPGGHAKQTAIFSLQTNDDLPTNLVLRRDMAKSITSTRVVDEFPIIQRVFDIGLPVPQPILVEADPSVLGGSFMLMTEVRDAVPAGTYFPEERRHAPRMTGPDFGKEIASALARLHTQTKTTASHAADDIAAQTNESYAIWGAIPPQPFSLTGDMAYAWLMSHSPPTERPQCLIHGDVGTHNMMVRDGHLAAVLDWELANLGDPAEDLAQCRMMLLPDVMPWEEFTREYVAAGGDPEACEPNAVAYYCVWTYVKHGLLNATLRDIYLKGERDDVISAGVAGHYFYRLMQYQGRALQIAIEASHHS